jgi:hypothetical protein
VRAGTFIDTPILRKVSTIADACQPRLSFHPEAGRHCLSNDLYKALKQFYHSLPDGPKICLVSQADVPGAGRPLDRRAIFAQNALVDGRCLVPTTKARYGRSSSALIQASFGQRHLAAELLEVFEHTQGSYPAQQLAHLRPLVPIESPVAVWSNW